ncbi:MAG: (2Fe-2S) ferredoxin domain-containing protein [Bacteroidales bacterium]
MSDSSNEIVICMGSSCFSRGNKQALSTIRSYLKERGLEDTVLFRGAHCFGKCEEGPVLRINGNIHTKVKPENIIDLLDDYFG